MPLPQILGEESRSGAFFAAGVVLCGEVRGSAILLERLGSCVRRRLPACGSAEEATQTSVPSRLGHERSRAPNR